MYPCALCQAAAAAAAATVRRNNNSDGIFLDGDLSNSNWLQWKERATTMGNSDKQQAMAATVAVIAAKTWMAAKEVRAAKALTS